MKILTLYQPYASLIACQLKQYETRCFNTNYRGLLAIHAGKRPTCMADINHILNKFEGEPNIGRKRFKEKIEPLIKTGFPHGAIVAICELTDCQKMWELQCFNGICINEQSQLELNLGDWRPGRYAWNLKNVLTLPQPISCRGYQGMRDLPADLEQAINRQINPGRYGT
jgi:activating signal cointegrator 1